MLFRAKDFKVKDKPKFEENVKVYSYSAVKKCVLRNELGEKDDVCRKMFKDLGVDYVDVE